MFQSRFIRLNILLAMSLVGCAATVTAVAAYTPLQREVQFRDLDLNRSEGALVLYGRLRGAAKQVCEPLDGATATQKHRFRACVAEALSNAVAAVGEPAVTKIFSAKTGKEPELRVASSR